MFWPTVQCSFRTLNLSSWLHYRRNMLLQQLSSTQNLAPVISFSGIVLPYPQWSPNIQGLTFIVLSLVTVCSTQMVTENGNI